MARLKSLSLKGLSPSKVSTKKLTMPKNSVKVSLKVGKQYFAKVDFGKVAKIKQKGSAQL
jgi:hypothetical protein